MFKFSYPDNLQAYTPVRALTGTFWDLLNRNVPGKIIFEVKAENVMEADKQFQLATGINPDKAQHIGREVTKV